VSWRFLTTDPELWIHNKTLQFERSNVF